LRRKRGTKQRQSRMPSVSPPSAPPALALGVIFGLIGGAIIFASIFLSWARDVLVRGDIVSLAVWNLTEIEAKYFALYLVAVAGALVASFSIVEMMARSGRIRHSLVWASSGLVSALIASLVIIIALYWINDDFLIGVSDTGRFGAAAFVAAFGCVLGVAGGIILLITHTRPHLMAGRTRPQVFVEGTRPVRTGPRPKEGVKEFSEAQGKKCPGCSSPVGEGWKICPVCGSRLG